MRYRLILPLAGLLAAAGGLAGCSEEKKDDARAPMTQPAPPADPTKPTGERPGPKPVPDQPPLKN